MKNHTALDFVLLNSLDARIANSMAVRSTNHDFLCRWIDESEGHAQWKESFNGNDTRWNDVKGNDGQSSEHLRLMAAANARQRRNESCGE